MTDITIQLSEAAATELAAALQVPAPEPIEGGMFAAAVFRCPSGVLDVRALKNVSSVVRVSAGVYDITFSTPASNVNFLPQTSGRAGTGVANIRVETPVSPNSIRVTCWNNTTVADADFVSLVVWEL